MGRKKTRQQRRPAGDPQPTPSPSLPPAGSSSAIPPIELASPILTRRHGLVGTAGLILVCVLHFGWRVEPALRYHQAAPAFFLDSAFLARFFDVPGGPLQCLAAAMAQLNFHPWLGTLAFAALLVCAFVLARRVHPRDSSRALGPAERASGGRPGHCGVAPSARGTGRDAERRCETCGPGRRLFETIANAAATGLACGAVLLLAALPGRFAGDVEATALGLLVALGVGNVWLTVPRRAALVQVAVCWTLALLAFYVAGAVAMILFLAIAVAVELVTERRPGVALGCALAALLVLIWWWLRPAFKPFAAMRGWGTGWTFALHAAVFAYVPAAMILHAASRALGTPSLGLGRLWRGDSPVGVARAWGCGSVVALVFLFYSLDQPRRALARIDFCAGRQDWTGVLQSAPDVRSWDATSRLHLARALFRTGRLIQDLFSFPRRREWDLLPGYDAGLEMSRALAHTLFELGQVNLAEHLAHEALELEGPRPGSLRLLANINMLRARPQAARVFLNRLRLAPFHRAEAERELRRIAADPGGSDQADLAVVRTRLVRTDEPDSWLPTERLLRQLLEANRTNRMAFDYLVAHRLLEGQIEELLPELGLLRGFGETALPRPCEEALLAHREALPAAAAALRGWAISAESVERHRRFNDVARRYPGPTAAARTALAIEFGDTYWFYHLFGDTAPIRRAPALPAKP